MRHALFVKNDIPYENNLNTISIHFKLQKLDPRALKSKTQQSHINFVQKSQASVVLFSTGECDVETSP